jgi:hypothetical protein
MAMTSPIQLTEHALMRTRQRLGLNPRQTERRALEVYARGRRVDEQPAPIRRFLESEVRRHPGTTIRVTGREVWVFGGNPRNVVLVTVWLLTKALYLAGQRARLDAVLNRAAS